MYYVASIKKGREPDMASGPGLEAGEPRRLFFADHRHYSPTDGTAEPLQPAAHDCLAGRPAPDEAGQDRACRNFFLEPSLFFRARRRGQNENYDDSFFI